METRGDEVGHGIADAYTLKIRVTDGAVFFPASPLRAWHRKNCGECDRSALIESAKTFRAIMNASIQIVKLTEDRPVLLA
jgi:hypothetical protein